MSPGYGNTIAHNGSNGVEVTGVHMVGNPIRGHSIYANQKMGISSATLREPEPPYLPRSPDGHGRPRVADDIAGHSRSRSVSTSTPAILADSPRLPARRALFWASAVVTASGGYTPFAAVLAATEQGEVITATATDYWGTTTQFSIGATAR